MEENKFKYGEKVIFIPENKIYDFGYISKTRDAVIYVEGERNMQDSIAVNTGLLKKVNE